MKFLDAAPIAGTRRTSDGYLVADVRTARTGIQVYAGWEVGKPDLATVSVYRPADQVFSRDSMSSYAHRPVTNDHPDVEVTADTWKDYAVGQIGDEIARDGEFVRVPLIVMDASAIKAIEAGKQELSAGYTCDLAFEDGTTPEGQPYQAVQRNIKINHVAIVARGRAGSQARIGDGAAWGASPITEDKGLAPITKSTKGDNMSDALKTVVLGDKAVQVAVADVAAIEAFKADSTKALADAKADFDKAMAAKDAELAKAHAERDDAKGKILDAAALDKLVQARTDLIDAAKKVAPKVETAGLSDAAIRRAAVVAVRGEDAVKDKSDAYIDAAFDILVEDADKVPNDPLRDTLKGGLKVVGDASTQANDAWQKSVADLNDWRKEA